jgi:hypothetical protein
MVKADRMTVEDITREPKKPKVEISRCRDCGCILDSSETFFGFCCSCQEIRFYNDEFYD